MNRRLLFAPLAVLLALLPSRAARAGASARLVYLRSPGAEQCPGEGSIRAAVATRLGYDPFFPWAHDTVFVEVSRADGAFRVQIKLVGEDNLQRGARAISVKGQDCAAILDAMALTMSLAIDPASILGAPPPATQAEGTPPVPVGPPTVDPASSAAPEALAPVATASPSTPDTELHAHAGLAVAGFLGSGPWPAPAAGGIAFVGASWRALSLDVEGRADAPAAATEESGVRVQSSVLAASLVPCLHVGLFSGCIVAGAGQLTAMPVNVTTPATRTALWLAGGPRAGVELPVSGTLTFRAYGEVSWTLQNRLELDNLAPFYTFSPVSGGLGIGMGWRFL